MKNKIIISIILIALILVIILISGKKTANLNAEEYKQILLQLGYSEDDIWDKKLIDDDLDRWVGISGFKLYACLFEYNSNEAVKIKKQEIEEYYSTRKQEIKILYLKMEKNMLIVIASDKEHEEEANKIIEKITND